MTVFVTRRHAGSDAGTETQEARIAIEFARPRNRGEARGVFGECARDVGRMRERGRPERVGKLRAAMLERGVLREGVR